MTFDDFRMANFARCIDKLGFGHNPSSWTTSEWFVAVMGELGEAAKVAKKLNRVRDGIPGNTETEVELREKLIDELADTAIYLDLLFSALGWKMEDAIVHKWNRTSAELGYHRKLE